MVQVKGQVTKLGSLSSTQYVSLHFNSTCTSIHFRKIVNFVKGPKKKTNVTHFSAHNTFCMTAVHAETEQILSQQLQFSAQRLRQMLCVCKLQLLQKNGRTFLAVVQSCLLVENYGALMHLLCWLFKPNSDQSPSLRKPTQN